MTITAPIYNEAGELHNVTFEYYISCDLVTVKAPILPDDFGTGWVDDLTEALNQVIEFDFTLKMI